MNNEVLFLLKGLLDVVCVLFAFHKGKTWVYATIVVNLILISTLGAKLITLFGFVTNVGNAYYASVFVAIHLLTEHGGRKEGFKAMWVGFGSLVFFLIMTQFSVHQMATPENAAISGAIDTLFSTVPRIALASMTAYLIAQYANVFVFDDLHQLTGKTMLWLRDIAAHIVGQFIDSAVFFFIAFYGVISTDALWQSVLIGLAAKVLIGLMGTGALYASYRLKPVDAN